MQCNENVTIARYQIYFLMTVPNAVIIFTGFADDVANGHPSKKEGIAV